MKRPNLPALSYDPKGLELTDDEFHGLHVRLEKTRRTSSTVAVDRQALTRLLADHGRLYAHIDSVEHAARHAKAEE